MTDYYSVLARAVVNLEAEDGGAREELYERARKIIISELQAKPENLSAHHHARASRAGGGNSQA